MLFAEMIALASPRHARRGRKPSKVLILIHRGGPDAERRIREIAALYCRRFDQQSAMRVRDPVSAEFLGMQANGMNAEVW